LNRPKIAGVNATLDTAYYSKRGPSVAAKMDYKKEDYFGYMLLHGVADQGWDPFKEDENLPIQQTATNTSNQNGNKSFEPRGRALWRHHQYFKNDWELIAEVSWLSDRDFLQDWYQQEFDTGKEQETLLYLKKAWDNNAFTILFKPRINSFLNQAEKLPEIKYYKLGEPMWHDRLVYFSENSAAIANYAVDDQRLDRQSSGMLGRLDTRHEWDLPFQRGPFKIVPYVTVRLTDWTKGSDSMITDYVPPADQVTSSLLPDSTNTGSGGLRAFLATGVKSSVTFTRTYNDIESRFWDVHRLRHIIEPMFNVHLAADTVDRNALVPLDPGVEGITGASAVDFGIHQRLQTKRGGPGAWRTVDWMRLDLDFVAFANNDTNTFFENEFTRPNRTAAQALALDRVFARGEWFSYRPEDSLALSTFNWYYEWRASDTTTLMWDGNLGEGGLARMSFGASLQRTPRWRMYFGDRYLQITQSNDLIFQSHYKINRKYDWLFSAAYDTMNNQLANVQVTLVRKCQRFYVAVTLDLSNIAKQNQQGGAGAQSFMITIWPEGASELTIGDRNASRIGSTSSATRLP
ncbi:MAG: LPS assembly protein LptD, partial [Phycisphaerae bacterium]|nr:LPS assembly protein LptD [Phycisphaerae bacterium]